MSRGLFILVEGLDRAGKSSQCDNLVNGIVQFGQKCQLLKFPDRTTAIGQMINSYLTDSANELSDEAIHLLFSANRWEAVAKIHALLDSGVNVVVDRYIYSGIAFSAAKNRPGMSIEWCGAPDRGLPLPDVTFFLDVSEEVAKKRSGFGDERYENIEMQNNVRKVFRELRSDDWNVISADGAIEEVSEQMWRVVEPLLNTGSREALKTFQNI